MNQTYDWTQVQPGNKWFILSKQKQFALWALYSSIGSMMLGFDFGLAGTATALPAFQQTMGVPYPSQPSGYLIPAYVQSAWSAVTTAGEVVGVLISGQLMERIGRKHSIFAGIVLTSAGIAMQIVSHDWKLFLGGRLVNAIGFGIVFVISPVWIGETVRPELRGLFLCITNGSIVLGQFILSIVAYGAGKIEGKWSYQMMVILQFAFVFFLLIGYPFFPESPYYLLKKNNEEKATSSLRRIHGNADPGFIEAEVSRLQEVIRVGQNLEAAAGMDGRPFIQCFKGANLKRTLIAILPAAAQQFIGAAFVLGYITYFLSLLGIKDYFTVSVALYVVMLVSNISAFPCIEMVGRRPLLLYGMVSLTLIELLMGIMGCVESPGALWVILVSIFLWALAYQVSIGAVGFALGSEVPTPALRPMTISLIGVTQGFSAKQRGWLIGFVTPYMINPDSGNLGAKVGFIFAGFGLPLCIIFYFFIPETLGSSFADMDYLFESRVKPRHFKKALADYRNISQTGLKGGGGSEALAPTVNEIEETQSKTVSGRLVKVPCSVYRRYRSE